MNEIIISQIRQRLEILYQMVDELERSGGGGGEPGTTNYNDLTNKPSVNGHILIGSKTSSDLDLQPVIPDLSTIRSGAALGATAVQPSVMEEALDDKVDKVNGKGLSTNDFTDEDKAQITTNKNGIAVVANAGAKNLMRNIASSQVVGGVTFTVNADGTITANGTKTNNDWFYLSTGNSLAAGTYVLSSGLAPQSDMSIRLLITTTNSLGSAIMSTEGTRQAQIKQLTSDYTGLYYAIRISSGTTVNNIVFKPMLRRAEITDDSFVPYAPTNRELYEMILALQ